jgi:hypothetical protein
MPLADDEFRSRLRAVVERSGLSLQHVDEARAPADRRRGDL